jgi:hypothetical protein
MVTFRFATEVKEDRRVVLTLPAEVPTGRAELVVTVATPTGSETRPPRTSLADWAESHAENWGSRLSSEDVESFTGRRF